MGLQYKYQFLEYPQKQHFELLSGVIPKEAKQFYLYPSEEQITNPEKLRDLCRHYILKDENLVLGLESRTKEVACMILTYQDGVCLESKTETLVLH